MDSASLAPSASADTSFRLLQLPDECILHVLAQLRLPDLFAMMQTCTLLRSLADSNVIWVRECSHSPFSHYTLLQRRLSERRWLFESEVKVPSWKQYYRQRVLITTPGKTSTVLLVLPWCSF